MQKGLTLIELIVALVISGILTATAVAGMGYFGTGNKVKREASKLIDNFWQLRADAISGKKNPCLDFPQPDSVRIYSDLADVPDGYGAGDVLISKYKFYGKVRYLSILGGDGPTHSVCFSSQGVTGSAFTALDLTLGVDPLSPYKKRVYLLPSTGIAKMK